MVRIGHMDLTTGNGVTDGEVGVAYVWAGGVRVAIRESDGEAIIKVDPDIDSSNYLDIGEQYTHRQQAMLVVSGARRWRPR